MNTEEANRFQKRFDDEVAKIQETVGARGMEFLWNGRRFRDLLTAKNAISLHVRSGMPLGNARVTQPSHAATQGITFDGLLYAISGALLFGAVVIGLEALLVLLFEQLSGSRIVPRGLGWIVMPITAMVAGYRMGPIAGAIVATKTANTVKVAEVRYLLAGSGFWTIAVLLFVVMFEPFGYYMRDRDYWTVAKAISFPIFLGLLALVILGLARKQSR